MWVWVHQCVLGPQQPVPHHTFNVYHMLPRSPPHTQVDLQWQLSQITGGLVLDPLPGSLLHLPHGDHSWAEGCYEEVPERYEGAGVLKEVDVSLEMEDSGIPRMFVGAAELPCPCAPVQPWSAIVSLLFCVRVPQSSCGSWVGPEICPVGHCCTLTLSSQLWASP